MRANSPSPLAEALHCALLGLRDALHPALITLSLGVWALAFLVMTALYALGWSWLAPALEGVAEFAVLGLPGWLGWTPATGGFLSELAGYAETVLQWLLLAALFAVGVLLLARVILELVLMGQVQRRVLSHYPKLAASVERPWRADLRDLAGNLGTWLVGSLLCLCIPLIGGALLILLTAYLNVRGLVNDAFDGVVAEPLQRRFVTTQRPTMLLLGAVVGLVMLVPLLGLIGPSLLGAATCHLTFRWLGRQHEAT